MDDSRNIAQPDVASLARRLLADTGVRIAPAPLQVSGADPVLPSPFPLGSAVAAVAGACGLALAEIWRLRTSRQQTVSVDVREAAAALLSFRLQRLNGAPTPGPGDGHPYVGLFEARDGRWVAVHGGFPSLEGPVKRLLDGPVTRDDAARSVARRDALEWEEMFADARPRQCCVMARTPEEWRNTSQGALLASRPCVDVIRIGDSPPEPLSSDPARPLSGLRVLDLTRILAGPLAGKFLTANGAQVLLVNSPKLPNVEAYLLETGHGKRSTWLDLDEPGGAEQLRQLVAGGDVFVQSYRTGALSSRGFGPEDLAAVRPGIIYTSISCFGSDGEWAERPGWELLGQTATGIAVQQGTPEQPLTVKAYPCDYSTGYFASLGILAALILRAQLGGSYHVRATLCRSGMFVESLGARFARSAGGSRFPDPNAPTQGLEVYCREGQSQFGHVRYLPPPLSLSETPPFWAQLSVRPGSDAAVWLDDDSGRRRPE